MTRWLARLITIALALTGNVGALGISVTPASQWARAWPIWGPN